MNSNIGYDVCMPSAGSFTCLPVSAMSDPASVVAVAGCRDPPVGCGTVDAAPTAVVGLHLPQLQQGGHHNRMQLADAAATSTLSSSTGENLGILPKLSCDVCKVYCSRCDESSHRGKSETEAPRFRVEALPLAVVTNEPCTLLEDDDLLMDVSGKQGAGAQLLDMDWWTASLGSLDTVQNRSGAHSGTMFDTLKVLPAQDPESSLDTNDSIDIYGFTGVESQQPSSPLSSDSNDSNFSLLPASSTGGPRTHRSSSSGGLSVRSMGVRKAAATSASIKGSTVTQARCGAKGLTDPNSRRCVHCGVAKTPQWRAGPLGQKTLCNACGVRFKAGRLSPVVAYPPPGYKGPVCPPPPPPTRGGGSPSKLAGNSKSSQLTSSLLA